MKSIQSVLAEIVPGNMVLSIAFALSQLSEEEREKAIDQIVSNPPKGLTEDLQRLGSELARLQKGD